MRMRFVTLLVLSLVVAGCQKDGKAPPSQQELAAVRWNAARAAVLGSLARSQLDSGNFDKCRQTLEEALALDPQNAKIRVLYAKLAIEQGQLDVADRELTLARGIDPNDAEVDYLAGIVYQRWQKPQMAYDLYASAAEKDPKEVAYLMAQAEMLVVLGQPEKALSLLRSRVVDFHTSAPLHHAIGQLSVTQREYASAVESLRHASVLAGDDETIREHFAMSLYYNGQYREAAEQVTRLLRDEKNQKRAELYVILGECQLHLGRTRDARGSFDTASTLDPSSAETWLSLTKTALRLDDTRRAELALRKAMALAPESHETQLMLGYLRLRQDMMPEALAAFEQASRMDPHDPMAVCMAGYVLEKMGRTDHAVQYYARALRLKPDDELASRLMAAIDAGER